MFKDLINSLLSLIQGKTQSISPSGYKPIGGIDTKKFEGLRLHVYKCTAGKSTIGYGHNLQGGNDNNLDKLNLSKSLLISGSQDLTLAEADALFDLDYADALNDARRLVRKLDSAPPAVKAVLGDLSFNMGYPTLSTFKATLAAFNAGDWKLAGTHLKGSKWYKQVKSRAIAIVKALQSVP